MNLTERERSGFDAETREITVVLITALVVVLNHVFGFVKAPTELAIPSIVAILFSSVGLYKCIFANDTKKQWFYMTVGVLIFMVCALIDHLR